MQLQMGARLRQGLEEAVDTPLDVIQHVRLCTNDTLRALERFQKQGCCRDRLDQSPVDLQPQFGRRAEIGEGRQLIGHHLEL